MKFLLKIILFSIFALCVNSEITKKLRSSSQSRIKNRKNVRRAEDTTSKTIVERISNMLQKQEDDFEDEVSEIIAAGSNSECIGDDCLVDVNANFNFDFDMATIIPMIASFYFAVLATIYEVLEPVFTIEPVQSGDNDGDNAGNSTN